MEVKINREIRDYAEKVYFGLSLRQFVFSLLACGVAVGLYFLLRPVLGIETLSWLCILGAAPFAALGFFSYHGMTAERVLLTYIRSEFLTPKELTFVSENYYDGIKSEEPEKKAKTPKPEKVRAEKPEKNKPKKTVKASKPQKAEKTHKKEQPKEKPKEVKKNVRPVRNNKRENGTRRYR